MLKSGIFWDPFAIFNSLNAFVAKKKSGVCRVFLRSHSANKWFAECPWFGTRQTWTLPSVLDLKLGKKTTLGNLPNIGFPHPSRARGQISEYPFLLSDRRRRLPRPHPPLPPAPPSPSSQPPSSGYSRMRAAWPCAAGRSTCAPAARPACAASASTTSTSTTSTASTPPSPLKTRSLQPACLLLITRRRLPYWCCSCRHPCESLCWDCCRLMSSRNWWRSGRWNTSGCRRRAQTRVQMEWSLWSRDIEHEIVPLCRWALLCITNSASSSPCWSWLTIV